MGGWVGARVDAWMDGCKYVCVCACEGVRFRGWVCMYMYARACVTREKVHLEKVDMFFFSICNVVKLYYCKKKCVIKRNVYIFQGFRKDNCSIFLQIVNVLYTLWFEDARKGSGREGQKERESYQMESCQTLPTPPHHSPHPACKMQHTLNYTHIKVSL